LQIRILAAFGATASFLLLRLPKRQIIIDNT
jgi:hypothetical protein